MKAGFIAHIGVLWVSLCLMVLCSFSVIPLARVYCPLAAAWSDLSCLLCSDVPNGITTSFGEEERSCKQRWQRDGTYQTHTNKRRYTDFRIHTNHLSHIEYDFVGTWTLSSCKTRATCTCVHTLTFSFSLLTQMFFLCCQNIDTQQGKLSSHNCCWL